MLYNKNNTSGGFSKNDVVLIIICYFNKLGKKITKFVGFAVLLQLDMPRIMKIFYQKKIIKKIWTFFLCVISIRWSCQPEITGLNRLITHGRKWVYALGILMQLLLGLGWAGLGRITYLGLQTKYVEPSFEINSCSHFIKINKFL